MARGWCQSHYNRNYKYGDPMAGPESRSDPKPCEVDGCDRTEKLRKGYCTVHYQRFMATGFPGPPVGQFDMEKAERRFWTFVDKSLGEDGCWPWMGRSRGKKKGHSGKPYGEFTLRRKTVSSHRLSYEFTHKVKLTPAEPIHHICGNSLCQNPKHLQVTTSRENTAEMLERTYYLKRIAELENMLERCSCNV